MFLPDLSAFDAILLEHDYHNLMFCLETSGRPSLTIRQACAIESAQRASGRVVILAMSSQTADVCNPNVASVLGIGNLLIVHLNRTLLVSGTSLQGVWDDGRMNKSCCEMIHTSDIGRMAIVHR